MHCLVLGGTGFIGTHLVHVLRQRGHRVRILDLRSRRYGSDAEGCEYFYGDWQDSGLLSQALEGGVECVYHLIGNVDVQQANADPAEDARQTILGSLNLFHACVEHRIRRVVFVSSGGSIYGIPKVIPIPEDHPTHPVSAHGVSKLAVEKYLHLFYRLHGLEYQIARCANPYGEWQDPLRGQGAVAVFLLKALGNEPITVWGDGSVVRDYIYVGDVALALAQLGEYSEGCHVFNVGAGKGVSLLDLLKVIAELTGRRPHVIFDRGRPYDVPVNVLDISSIVSRVGWHPKVDLVEGVSRTLEWIREVMASHPGQ